jgi:hypothetical protein
MSSTPEREAIDVKALRDAALADQIAAAERARQAHETALRDIGWEK